MKNDLHTVVRTKTGIKPVALTTVAGVAGKIVDRKGYQGVEVIFSFGEITATNATMSVILLEGDATGSMTSVADADLIGTEALAGVAAGTPRTSGTLKNTTRRLGYTGRKRYIQPKIVPTVTAATIVSAVVLLHSPDIAPATNP